MPVAAIVQTLEDRTLLAAPVGYDQWEATLHEQPLFGTVFADDLDGDPLTYFESSGPGNGILDFNSDGSFTYTPDALYTGSDSFTWYASDGIDNSNIATVYFDVTNNAPVGYDQWETAPGGQSLFSSVYASDLDGDPLTYFESTGPGNGILDFNSDGSFTYTPDFGFTGSDSFTWYASDGIDDGNLATVYIDVTNGVPQAFDSWRSTLHDVPLNDSVFWDAIDDDGDELTFSLDTGPIYGTLYDAYGSPLSTSGSFDGGFEYVPNTGFTGNDSFTWHASDGIDDSNVVTLTIEVYNTAPQVYWGWYATPFEVPLDDSVAGNAFDQDGDSLSYALNTAPAEGSLQFNSDGSFTYTPDENFSGSDSFTWYASDGLDDSLFATAYIIVGQEYGVLTANGDVGIAERGTAATIAVLDNDDSPAGGLTVVDATDGSYGTVTFTGSSVTYTPADPDFTGHDTFQYQVEDAASDSAWATVDVYFFWIDLDVNNDGDLLDAVDGTENYLPGYVGDDDVLSTGTEFADWQYLGQEMRVIVEGIGYDSGVQQVTFELLDVTDYEGYSENTSDSGIEGTGNDHDFSFTESTNQDLFVLTQGAGGGDIEQDRSWATLWAKDYGAAGTIQVDFQIGTVAVSYVMSAPKDADDDKIADSWEESMVTLWNTQYGTSETVSSGFFGATDDKEMKDPDGAGNTDGGRNLPAHKTAGDSLTVKQEYRGFVLGGGGFNIYGGGGHSGGHIRLSPVAKELLVEVDIMKSVTAMPSLADIKEVLAIASKGFSNKYNGAGIQMFWVIDEKDAAHDVFDDSIDRVLWAGGARRNAKLKDEFVHLMFVDDQKNFPNTRLGITGTTGVFVFVTNAKKVHDDNYAATDIKKMFSHIVAHELTHALLNTASTNGFDAGEHVVNADSADPPNSSNDKKYLMYNSLESENVETIIFSDIAIKQIDLTHKETVEV